MEEVKKAKLTSWMSFVDEDLQNDPWGTVNKLAANKIKTSTTMSNVRRSDGSATTLLQDTLEEILSNLMPDDDINNENQYHTEERPRD